MAFSSHTFEVSAPSSTLGFVFEQDLGEGQKICFVAQFPDGTVGADRIADEIFGSIIDSFSGSRTADPSLRFEESLKSANLTIKKYRSQIPERPNIVVSFFDFLELYIAECGTAEGYLVRGGSLSPIQDIDDDGDEPFVNILSGQTSLNDTLIFATSPILDKIDQSLIVDRFIPQDFMADIDAFQSDVEAVELPHTVFLVVGVGKISKPAPSTGGIKGLLERGKSALDSVTEKVKTIATTDETDVVEPPEARVSEPAQTDEAVMVAPPTAQAVDPNEVPPAETPVSAPAAVPTSRRTAVKQKLSGLLPKRISKGSLLLAVGVLGLLLVALLGRWIMNYKSEETLQLEEKVAIARQSLVEADTFILQGERDEAKNRLNTAQDAAQDVFNSGEDNFRITAQAILSEIEEKRLSTENAERLEAAATADLGLTIEDVDAQGIEFLRETLYIHDGNRVHKTIAEKVDPGPTLTDESGETVLASATRTDQNTVLFLTDTPRIIEYRDGSITGMSTEDETWHRGIDIDTYGRYIYVLDPGENQIWKYERRRSNFGVASAYNLESKANLGDAVSMAIDGSIFVLSSDGVVQKLFKGQKVDYTLTGMPSGELSGTNLKIKTSIELGFLYILDPEQQRLLVLEKGENEGKYLKQVLYGISDVRDFTINRDGTRAFLITKDRVYSISL